jgi:ABC-type dipeptide/oligopeptide/nickel transport system ATPase subunit
MNGFEHELREKVLGFTSHVTAYKNPQNTSNSLKEFENLKLNGHILGYSPYIEKEILLSSDSGTANAVFRAIDPSWEKDVGVTHNNIIFGASDYNNDLDIQDILETVNIKDFADKLILKENEIITQDGSNISGGEKQRVIFGRSLFKDFELLILDEPTSSLDKENSYEIINSIFKKYSSKTIIIVTHKIDPRLKFDRVLNMSYGKIE